MEHYEPPELKAQFGKALTLTGYLVATIIVLLVGISLAALIGNAQMSMHFDRMKEALDDNSDAIRSLERKVMDTQESQRRLKMKMQELE